jgi:hypothetical protein
VALTSALVATIKQGANRSAPVIDTLPFRISICGISELPDHSARGGALICSGARLLRLRKEALLFEKRSKNFFPYGRVLRKHPS